MFADPNSLVVPSHASAATEASGLTDEACLPLGLDSLWVGIPAAVAPRGATLTNLPPTPPGAPGMAPGALSPLAIPPQVGTAPEVFGRADVRRACLPGAGGIMNARRAVRCFAMLVQGGALDGVRLLSEERVRWFSVPLPPCEYDYGKASPTTAAAGVPSRGEQWRCGPTPGGCYDPQPDVPSHHA